MCPRQPQLPDQRGVGVQCLCKPGLLSCSRSVLKSNEVRGVNMRYVFGELADCHSFTGGQYIERRGR